MKRSDILVSSLESSWKNFSKAWKDATRDPEESQIHILRVASRRIASTLAVVDCACSDLEADRLRRRFKKILKHLGALRDAHVQLLLAETTPHKEAPKAFRRALKNKVVEEKERGAKFLRSSSKAKLRKSLDKLEKQLRVRLKDITPEKIRGSLQKEVHARYDDFAQARSRFIRRGENSLHDMRIALKNLRYGVETTAPLLNIKARAEIQKLRSLQKKLGGVRDSRIFGMNLEEWAQEHGDRVVQETRPLIERLEQRYVSAIRSLRSDAQLNSNLLPIPLRGPARRRPHRAVPKDETVSVITPLEIILPPAPERTGAPN